MLFIKVVIEQNVVVLNSGVAFLSWKRNYIVCIESDSQGERQCESVWRFLCQWKRQHFIKHFIFFFLTENSALHIILFYFPLLSISRVLVCLLYMDHFCWYKLFVTHGYVCLISSFHSPLDYSWHSFMTFQKQTYWKISITERFKHGYCNPSLSAK